MQRQETISVDICLSAAMTMATAISVTGFPMAYFGQLHLALILLLQDRGDTQQLTPPTSAVYFRGPVCPTGCSSCSKLNGCVTCQPNYVLLVHWHAMRQIGNCVRECPIGYFIVNTNKGVKCIKCGNPRCELCTNSTNCTRCHPPFALHHGQCVIRCPADQPYLVESTGQCATHLNCEVGQWAAWEECRRNGEPVCGSKRGRQRRQRPIVQKPTSRGRQCPATIEFRKCRAKHRSCEDALVSDNRSGGTAKSLNHSAGRKWLELALKHRKRKHKHRHSIVQEHANDGNQRRQTAMVTSESRERVTPSFHRRRVDVNLLESRDIN